LRALGRKATGERLARMQASSQWAGNSFRNIDYQPVEGPREPMPLREFLCPGQQRKPLGALPTVDPRPQWKRPLASALRVTWLGHSTLVIELDGYCILTDPMWGERASPSRRVGPRRFQPVPVALAELPPLDLVLLSHDHYDHLDYSTIRALAPLDVPFVAPLGVGAHLEFWGIDADRITELDWWEQADLPGGNVEITATPAQHFSGRGPGSRNHTLWASYVIEGLDRKLFFGGDSGLMPGFNAIGDRFGTFDLVCLEIGAYHPAWSDIHLGPVNALAALDALGGGPLLPIHWGTFDLATHRWDQPIEVLTSRAADLGARLLTPRLGEPVEPDPSLVMPQWWRDVAALHRSDGQESGEPSDAAAEVVTSPVD